MDKKSQKSLKIVLYVSLTTAIAGGVVAGILFKGPAVIGAFFGVILGFFLPWSIVLMGYAIYTMSNPAAAFKDEIAQLHSEDAKGENLALEIETLKTENKTLTDLNQAIQSRLNEIQKMTTLDQKPKAE